MNNVKKKHDNNNWVRDVLKDSELNAIAMRKKSDAKRTETRRKRLLEKEIKMQKDMNTIRVELNLPLVKAVKPKAKRGYIKRFF
ncbi:hypothetical protein CMI47_07325 [Candidatus Pacearchaeota archaeon]|mgnify:CR=1 FL=1|jgi:phosphatidate phosphatase PAH1|nr:hypothetical protein [Candidatus Pacearchaeota archaeon]|tara:strand:- start:144 stop:395 length:252 start_codon:yes stop_codon:yes gene_type:complete